MKEGIVTVADSKFFPGLQLLCRSISECYPVPLICFDAGLTVDERRWISTHLENVSVRSIPSTVEILHIRSTLSRIDKRGRNEWILWICPFLIADSPFRKTIWLDCDLIVLRDLGKLFNLIDDGPIFTPSDDFYGCTPNDPRLYSILVIDRAYDTKTPLVNAGVIGLDVQRDKAFLENYIRPVLAATEDDRIRDFLSWHDQGALIWAIQNLGLEDRVLDLKWNFPVRSLELLGYPSDFSNYYLDNHLFKNFRSVFSNINILHWNGLQQKLWHSLRTPLRA